MSEERKRGRQYPDGPLEPEPGMLYSPLDADAFALETLGQVMASMFGATEPEPGPPYIHTFVLPEPEYDGEGNEILRKPDPSFTLEGNRGEEETGAQ